MRIQKVDEKLAKIRNRRTPYEVSLKDIIVSVLPDVYPTSAVSELVVDCMEDPDFGLRKGDLVLDYGTGTGFLAIQAALRGAKVVALDINPQAVQCAYLNVKRYGLESKVEVREGACLEALQANEQFDVVLAGLPWDDGEVADYLELSMYDPSFRMRRELFAQGPQRLRPNARILFTYADFAEQRNLIAEIDHRYNYRVVRTKEIGGAQHYVFLITLKSDS